MTSATAETITSTEETLRLDGITVRFGGLTALSDISLTTTAGEFVGLIGPNGSGKTTMLSACTGASTWAWPGPSSEPCSSPR
jgi:branched-chain amino acid transport system ATP-binding protein